MKLFDNDLDVDKEMLILVEKCADINYPEYIIMSNATFTVFSELSKNVDKKKMTWDSNDYETYNIAINKALRFGEVIIK